MIRSHDCMRVSVSADHGTEPDGPRRFDEAIEREGRNSNPSCSRRARSNASYRQSPMRPRPIPNSRQFSDTFAEAKMSVCLLLLSWLSIAVPMAHGQLGNSKYGSTITRPHSDWDYDGKRILGHIGFDLYLWDARTGEVLQKFIGHSSYIVSAQLSPDGKYVLSSSGLMEVGDFIPDCGLVDASTRLWNVRTGKELWRKEGQIAGQFSPDGKRLLTFALTRRCLDTGGISMWDVASGRKLFDAEKIKSKEYYAKLAFSPDGHTFVSQTYADDAIVYDSENGNQLGKVEKVDSFNFYGEHGEIATFGTRGVEVWSRSGERNRQIPISGKGGLRPAWTPDGKVMADIRTRNDKSWAGEMRLWDLEAGTFRVVSVNGFQFLPSPIQSRGLLFLGGGAANSGYTPLKFTMYDMTDGKELWHGQEEAYGVLGYSPDGRTILVGGGPNFVIYDAGTGKPVVTLDILGDHAGDGFGGCYGAGGIPCPSVNRSDAFLGNTPDHFTPPPVAAGDKSNSPATSNFRGFFQYTETPDADPSVTHEVGVLVPTGLIVKRTATRISIREDASSARAVRVAVGKNMSLGMKTETWVYPVGMGRPARPFSVQYAGLGETLPLSGLLSLNVQAITNAGMDINRSLSGMPQDGVKYVLEVTVAVFETASRPQHMWMPEGSKYKVLWQTTFQRRPSDGRAKGGR